MVEWGGECLSVFFFSFFLFIILEIIWYCLRSTDLAKLFFCDWLESLCFFLHNLENHLSIIYHYRSAIPKCIGLNPLSTFRYSIEIIR